MAKLTGSLSLSPQEIAGAIERAKAALPSLAPLKSVLLKSGQAEVDLVFEAPLLGPVDLDLALSVTESG